MDQNVIFKAYLCNAIINSCHYRLCCNLIVSTYVYFLLQAEVSQQCCCTIYGDLSEREKSISITPYIFQHYININLYEFFELYNLDHI